MTGSGATIGLVLAFSTAPDGPVVAARHEPCAWWLCRRGRRSRRDGSMTTVRSGVPGHDDGAAFVRLRWGKLVYGPSGQRVQDKTAEGPYEIVCPGCGDAPGRDWPEISGDLRRIRGRYATKEGAEAALMDHIGRQTR